MIEIGKLSFSYYIIFGCLGFALALFFIWLNLNQEKTKQNKLNIIFVFSIAFTLSLIFSNIGNWLVMSDIRKLPIPQRISSAGMSFYWGLISFLAVSALLLKLFKLPLNHSLNQAVPSILIFHSVGRIGCFFNGCCYGRIIESGLSRIGLDRYPTQLIESIFLFILFVIFQFIIKKNRLIPYLYTYSTYRFFSEYLRGDYRGEYLFNIFSPAQLVSVGIITSLTIFIIYRQRRQMS